MPNKIDSFHKNILIVFAGASLANFFNLLYQLLIAHKLSAADFAAFNSLLAIFTVITSPLGTVQMAVTKYSAEFNARNQINKLKFLLSGLFKAASILAIVILLVFCFFSTQITNSLKIPSVSAGYILAILLALTCLTQVFAGGVQGLELFKWLASGSIIAGVLKLVFGFIFISLGYNIAGALGALLVSSFIGLVIYYFPLRQYIRLNTAGPITGTPEQVTASGGINYKEMFVYLFPVAAAYFCFSNLVNSDMVQVKYFFNPQDSGFYSLAQMLGKIFLFLPAAISLVMFPKTCGLNAKNMDTRVILKKSMLYVLGLCILSVLFYNIFPSFVLKVLTGKAYPESILLGRLFSISMSFFALLYVLIMYFLSVKDLRFIKYLASFTILQFLAVAFFHKNLIQVQLVLCVNAVLLFCIHLILANFTPSLREEA
ncbi:MAG: oligosaccharide flippase family protein [Candidatus Omnitrophota bacterium]